MAAYMIVLAKIADREAFLGGYGKAAAALIEQHGGRYLLRGPGVRLLEGDWGDGSSAVVSEWPDMTALRAFWDSPEYAEVKKLRQGVADCRVWAVEAP
ncbi:MAG: DUF1330 domain-containing protein [Phenylobacterium sp.]|uniref:DUF1330 domain-containing protein n=2 Tax=Caulobacterales TaxID=204458 RepID=UPI0025DE5C25|nr:DUF1330 domain-containing protein [Phenylobacterium sp.]MCA3711242.1 DUF1330 domain-containing protein [Phenylobacterium sp.]MCA3726374.1 DUF1330 domain-containing protein [Phenylobacterium sp.]MCA3734848.1 DUF1330 domain-containing protein [Phenylobacterium sp.]MCA3740972.1 DUF1330 domain-containing protein [Phenylobacterium sp.]MCA3747324.1 DUF1330 domain-containing protein [Phenylobacterium sp.]